MADDLSRAEPPISLQWYTDDEGLVISLKPVGNKLVEAGPVRIYLGDDVVLDETVVDDEYDEPVWVFRAETVQAGGLSGSTTDFFGHDVSISTGAYFPAIHGGYHRPYGEASVDGREYWLVPKDALVRGGEDA